LPVPRNTSETISSFGIGFEGSSEDRHPPIFFPNAYDRKSPPFYPLLNEEYEIRPGTSRQDAVCPGQPEPLPTSSKARPPIDPYSRKHQDRRLPNNAQPGRFHNYEYQSVSQLRNHNHSFQPNGGTGRQDFPPDSSIDG